MKRQQGSRAAMLTAAAIALLLLSACSDSSSSKTVSSHRHRRSAACCHASGRARECGDPVLSRRHHGVQHGAERNERWQADRVEIGGLHQRRRKEESDTLCRSVRHRQRCRGRLPNRRGGKQGRAWVQACGVAKSRAGGVRRHLASRHRDALWARRARRQADHVGNARGRHPRTPENSNSLISLGGAELTTAKEILGP